MRKKTFVTTFSAILFACILAINSLSVDISQFDQKIDLKSIVSIASADPEQGIYWQCYYYYDPPDIWHDDYHSVYCNTCQDVLGHNFHTWISCFHEF